QYLSRVSFMNNPKQQKPTLTGQRFKTRKREGWLCAVKWYGGAVTLGVSNYFLSFSQHLAK
ncbi:hypothetical protein scyTo_0019166, partial [Scyliorhinus torazame]|nr:hypothetical protein [Scyliorhinus torazame]